MGVPIFQVGEFEIRKWLGGRRHTNSYTMAKKWPCLRARVSCDHTTNKPPYPSMLLTAVGDGQRPGRRPCVSARPSTRFFESAFVHRPICIRCRLGHTYGPRPMSLRYLHGLTGDGLHPSSVKHVPHRRIHPALDIRTGTRRTTSAVFSCGSHFQTIR